jgi:transcriptional regulator with XRE-family HTH domain
MGQRGQSEGSRLKLARVRAGIRPTQLARALGIAPALLSDWEDGRRPISSWQRQQVLTVLDQLTLGGECGGSDDAVL